MMKSSPNLKNKPPLMPLPMRLDSEKSSKRERRLLQILKLRPLDKTLMIKIKDNKLPKLEEV